MLCVCVCKWYIKIGNKIRYNIISSSPKSVINIE